MIVNEPMVRTSKAAARRFSRGVRLAMCCGFLLALLIPSLARAFEPVAPDSAPPDSGTATSLRQTHSMGAQERIRLARAIQLLRMDVDHHAIRVWVPGETLVVSRPVFDSLGIHPSAARRTGVLQPEPTIAWHEVKRIDVRGSNMVRGALLGGLAVLIPGSIAASRSNDEMAGLGVTVGTLATTLIGGTIGALSAHWSRLHWTPPAAPAIAVASEPDTSGTERALRVPAVPSPAPSVTPSPAPSAAARAGLRPREFTNPKRGFFVNSPEAAMAVGFVASVAPAIGGLMIGVATSGAGETGFGIGTGVGVIAGPAIGLAVGGRRDLTKTGMIVRGVACAVGGAGWAVAASSRNENAGTIVGATAGLVAFVSWVHDLAITPSAVARGRAPLATVGVDANGRVVASLRF